MDNLLQEFEQQFSTVTAEITSKISQVLNKSISFEDIAKLEREIGSLLADANELLERMELEVREAPIDKREKLRNRLKSYEVELGRLRAEFNNAVKCGDTANEERNRQQLFGTEDTYGPSTSYFQENEQTQRLLQNNETLERTSVRIGQSYKASVESEQVGAQILNDLQHQRSTLTRARNRLHDADDELGQSNRILNSMMKRFKQNRFILAIVICVVAIVIFGMIYRHLVR